LACGEELKLQNTGLQKDGPKRNEKARARKWTDMANRAAANRHSGTEAKKAASVIFVVAAVGVLAWFGIVAVVDEIIDRAVFVTIHPDGVLTSPSEISFVAHNHNRLLAAQNLHWQCSIDYTKELNMGPDTPAPPVGMSGHAFRVPPSGNTRFSCTVSKSASSGARVVPFVDYRMLWTKSGNKGRRMIWRTDANPPQWVEDASAP
jgi:hypothetical protein